MLTGWNNDARRRSIDRESLDRKVGFGHFMATAGRHSLLEHEEEAHLAKLVAAGAAAAALLEEDKLGQKGRLRRIVRCGLEARDKLIRHNLRLAISIAKTYNRSGLRTLEIEDLISEATHGLIHAVSRFDAARGYRFTTYASWWIRQRVERAIMNQDSMMRVPVGVHQQLHELKKARFRIDQAGLPPDRDTLLLATEWDQKTLDRVLDAERLKAPVTLDRPVGDEEGSTLMDFLPDPSPDGGDELIASMELAELLEAVSSLDDRSRMVIEMRFGLLGQDVMTLQALGDTLGVSRESVRKIEGRALKRLRGEVRWQTSHTLDL